VATLGIDGFARTTDPQVFVVPPRSVLYDSTPVDVYFTATFTKLVPSALIKGSLSAGYAGKPPASPASPIHDPTRPVRDVLHLPMPPGAGVQTVNLYWQPDGAASPSVADTLNINVVATPKYQPRAPYDLVSEEIDPNGFLFNPRYGWQNKRFYETGRRDLWSLDMRPDIYANCLSAAEPQSWVAWYNDYNPFRNGYCKHSPGASSYSQQYCGQDLPAPYQASGPISCSSWSWKDNPDAAISGVACAESSPYTSPYHTYGHLNLGVVTLDGVARWDNAQHEGMWDYDWCTDLYPLHGVAVNNHHCDPIEHVPGDKECNASIDEPWVHTEINPRLFADHFDRGFWGDIRQAVHDAQYDCMACVLTALAGDPAGTLCKRAGGCNDDLSYSSVATGKQQATVAPSISGKRAIMIGLLGFDTGHDDAGAELHPVFGEAIHYGGTPLSAARHYTNALDQQQHDCYNPSVDDHFDRGCDYAYLHPELDPLWDVPVHPDDDVWAIWATNFGDEGFCSSRALHVLDGPDSIIGPPGLSTMAFRLPWAKDESGRPMADVEILGSTNFGLRIQHDIGRSDATYFTSTETGKSITVTFQLLPSDAHAFWVGDLHLKWKPSAPGPIAVLPAPPKPNLTPLAKPTMARALPAQESVMAKAQMTDAQRRAYYTALKSRPAIPVPPIVKTITGTRISKPPPPPPPIQPRAHVGGKVLAPGAAEEQAFLKRALCATYSGNVPRAPSGFCK
jgi:hypothetical protein